MKRETRYIVLKIKDIEEGVTREEREFLLDIRDRLNKRRVLAGKDIIRCVVVEHDWPEYEPTWNAIADRMDTKC